MAFPLTAVPGNAAVTTFTTRVYTVVALPVNHNQVPTLLINHLNYFAMGYT